MVGGVAVSVEERPELVVFPEEGIKDFPCRQRRRHGQIAAGQSLGQCQEIRLNAFLMGSKKGS